MENKLVDCKCGGKPDTDHDEDGVLIMVWCPDCEQYLAKENPPDDETLFDFWNRINAVPDSGDVEKLIAKIECAQLVVPPENSYVSTGWRIAKAMSIGLIRAHLAAKTGDRK